MARGLLEGGEGKGKEEERTIIIIITNDHLLDLSVPTHLTPKILVKRIEMVLQLTRIHFVLRIIRRVLVEVGQEDGLRI